MSQKNEQADQSLPLFQRPFRTRVRECWEHFAKNEAKLRPQALFEPGGTI